MGKKRVRIGDVFEIPLSDGRRAFGQYVYRSKFGPLIQVYDLITDKEFRIEELVNARPLFPPILTGLFAAIRTGLWKIVGRLPVKEFKHPLFVQAVWDGKEEIKARRWVLWDGEKETWLGEKLPDECKNLEYLVGWDPHDVVHRIETGEYIEPYKSLREKNEYKQE